MRPPTPAVFAKELKQTAMIVTPRRAGLCLGWRGNRLLLGNRLLALRAWSGLYFWLARGKTHRFELDDHSGHTAGAINRHFQTAFIALGTDAPDLARPHCHLRAGAPAEGTLPAGHLQAVRRATPHPNQAKRGWRGQIVWMIYAPLTSRRTSRAPATRAPSLARAKFRDDAEKPQSQVR